MRCLSHIASLAASVDDWDTLDCSQDDHEMGPPASRKTAPDTEWQVSGSIV